MRILWVEDNERFVRVAGREFLSGHKVTVATTLAQARVALAAHDFDLVLLDYDLPDGQGDELVKEILARGDVKVVGTSSHEAGNQALQAAGANAVCSKLKFQHLPALLETLRSG